MYGDKTSLQVRFLNQNGRIIFRTPIFVEAQVGSFLYYISDENYYRKTANAFGISRASFSRTIRKISYTITTFVGPKLVSLPTAEIQELTDKYIQLHSFQQCVGAINGTHIDITEPSERYPDFVNRKDYFSLYVRAVCDYKYCFQDVVVK